MTYKAASDLFADCLAAKLAAGGYSGITVTRYGLPDDDSALAVSVQTTDGPYDEALSSAAVEAEISARAADLQQAESLAQLCMHLLHRTYGYADPDTAQVLTNVAARSSPYLIARLAKGPYAVYGFRVTGMVTR